MSPSPCLCLSVFLSLSLSVYVSASAPPLLSLLLIIKSKTSSMLGKYSVAGLKLAILLPLLREHWDDRSASAGRRVSSLCHSDPSSSHFSAHYTSAQLCPLGLPFQKAVQETTFATIAICLGTLREHLDIGTPQPWVKEARMCTRRQLPHCYICDFPNAHGNRCRMSGVSVSDGYSFYFQICSDSLGLCTHTPLCLLITFSEKWA